jgi:hypothetical protein
MSAPRLVWLDAFLALGTPSRRQTPGDSRGNTQMGTEYGVDSEPCLGVREFKCVCFR